jgi:hypothetical protein
MVVRKRVIGATVRPLTFSNLKRWILSLRSSLPWRDEDRKDAASGDLSTAC